MRIITAALALATAGAIGACGHAKQLPDPGIQGCQIIASWTTAQTDALTFDQANARNVATGQLMIKSKYADLRQAGEEMASGDMMGGALDATLACDGHGVPTNPR